MLRLDTNTFSKKFIYSVWFLMSFQAGYVNVGGFITSGNFVSHVTGTSSQIGLNFSQMNYALFFTFITILAAFIGGANFAGRYIGKAKDEGKDPNYIFVLSVKAFFFGLVFMLSGIDWHIIFPVSIDSINLMIIFFLSFTSGMQNATCALSTDGFLKPTHMTGLSTDIGIMLARFPFSRKNLTEEHKKNLLRIGILGSFIFGGAVATIIFSANGHYGFLFPFISALSFLALAFVWENRKSSPMNGLVFKTAKNSIFVNLVATLLIGMSAIL